MEFNVKTLEGKDAGKVSLSDEIFGLDPREAILARMVRWHLARKQQGTHKSKTRSEVSRTGPQMSNQKGTRRPPHLSARAPPFPAQIGISSFRVLLFPFVLFSFFSLSFKH